MDGTVVTQALTRAQAHQLVIENPHHYLALIFGVTVRSHGKQIRNVFATSCTERGKDASLVATDTQKFKEQSVIPDYLLACCSYKLMLSSE
jgi:hypothetical protein